MSKLVKCKSCGSEIAKTAKSCPKCGAAQHTVAKTVCYIILVLAIVFLFGSCASMCSGNTETPQKVGEVTGGQDAKVEEPKEEKFSIGDTVELNDISVTLTNVTENTGKDFVKPTDGKVFVLCEFEIENNSDSDIGVSSLMSFEAYIDDYSTTMNLSALMSTDIPQLDGTIAAGKKMKGVIGYEANADWSTIEVRFSPDFWSSSDIIFEASATR